jgi:hypothetical protein
VSENIAQTARFNILNRLARECVARFAEPGALDRDSKYDETYQSVLNQLRASGASDAQLAQFAKLIARSTLFSALCVIDEGLEPFGPGQRAPGWSLRETNADGALTGREVGGLHESLNEIVGK